MRKLFTATSRSNKRIRNRRHDYGVLEDRRLLATLTSFNGATGELTINLTEANDTAVINLGNTQVTVRGSAVLSETPIINVADLKSIVVNGDSTKAFQSVVFSSLRFSHLPVNSFVAQPQLQTISVVDVNMITFNGNYTLSGDFTAVLDGNSGRISDGINGRIVVGGVTNIDAGNNTIMLDNASNDFVGAVSLRTISISPQTGSVRNSATISDANDIEFSRVIISGDLTVTAGGDITDTDDSIIDVGDLAKLSGANIALGNNTTGTTDIERVSITSPGHVELYQNNTVFFTGVSQMGSLDANTVEGIRSGKKTVINVSGLATLRGDAQIRIGHLPGDIFNAGELSFRSNNRVDILENSSTRLVGDNTARVLVLNSAGDITDADEATLNVTAMAKFNADNIYLGDTATDEFNAGSIRFFAAGDVFISEDSGTHITSAKNFANRLELVSAGAITDSGDAITIVTTLSRFDAASVKIGDSDTDSFTSGWIRFNTTGRFYVFENDSTQIVNENSAAIASIVSLGEITNGRNAVIVVSGSTSFAGAEIKIGNRSGDRLEFGGLLLNSPGSATVFEDDNTVFIGNSSVDLLRMYSVGGITDGLEANINVARVASLHSETAGITLGDSLTDVFNTTALTVDAENGVVNISENSGILLTGDSRARSLTLSADGHIRDHAFATVDVDFLLDITGNKIDLGNEATDWLGFGSVNFNTTGDTSIRSQRTMTLVGNSAAGGDLTLDSTGNIYDAVDAQTSAEQAFLSGVDIVLGDTAFDCFDVLSGNMIVTASGIENVTTGC